MKLHDLRPAEGSRKAATRVGRGIAAGKGKTAGRGTKGQKSRAGASIPAWFEGGQTPIHIRIPKLRGFRRRFKIEYQVVNLGRIAEYAEEGRFGDADAALALATAASARVGRAEGPLTVNPEILRAAGLISSLRVPVKILGEGEVARPLFVVADAFTRTARQKIEAAGGTAQELQPSDTGSPLRADVPRGTLATAAHPGAPDAHPGAPDDLAAAGDIAAEGDAPVEPGS